jgi:hypothetical protein
LKIAKPNGNAPKPIRVTVNANGEVRVTPVAADAVTGSAM